MKNKELLKRIEVLDDKIQKLYNRVSDIDNKDLEVGKWYKHANNEYPNWLVYYGENKKCYGFRTSGAWDDDSENEWFEYLNKFPMLEATPQEVESALIAEAKRRGFDYDDFVFEDITNILWANYDSDIDGKEEKALFNNGKWAEVIKPEGKPKVGDVVKAWDDDEDVYLIGCITDIDISSSFPFLLYDYDWFRHAKTLTQQEAIGLLFKK